MNILKLFKRRRPPHREATPERFEIALTGSGGQGIVLAGKILAEAAAIYDAKEAVMTQSYGPEARGGASKTEIIISSSVIDYPKVINMNVLLAMTRESLDRYAKLLDKNGLLIVDETFIKETPDGFARVFSGPFTSVAMKLFQQPIVANVIALGTLAALTHVVSREALIRAMLHRIPDKHIVINRIALDAGFKMAKDIP